MTENPNTFEPVVSDEIDREFSISLDDFLTVSELTAQGYSLPQIQQIIRQQRHNQTIN